MRFRLPGELVPAFALAPAFVLALAFALAPAFVLSLLVAQDIQAQNAAGSAAENVRDGTGGLARTLGWDMIGAISKRSSIEQRRGKQQDMGAFSVRLDRIHHAIGEGRGEGLAGGQQVSDKADLEANMVALGTEHDLIVMEGVEFLGRLEAVSTQINADEADGKAFAKQSGRVSGARGELELDLPQTVEDRHMRPYLALGYRWDGGDGKKGSVFEFGAGVSVQKKHFILEASARFQADPDKGEYERTSYALSLTHDL